MSARLATGFWVAAYLQRLGAAAIPAHLVAKGDPMAGAVLVKIATLDGRAHAFARRTGPEGRVWMELASGDEADVDASIARQRGFDPDLWVIEVEDRAGRSLLDEPGLE